jgi:beta-glucanase (GH16 family)
MRAVEVDRSRWALIVCLAAALVLTLFFSAQARAATLPAPNCGATLIPKSTGGTWRCSFSDDFDGTALDTSKWTVQRTDNSGYTNGLTACFVDSTNNVSVANGSLDLTVRKEAAPFTCSDPYGSFSSQYTSGMVTTFNHFSQAYGRFEVRARILGATSKGLQSSLWLWPVNPARYGAYPASGEIDFAEMYSNLRGRAIPYVHYNPLGTDPNVTNNNCMITDITAFHTYAVEWTPTSIKIIYDGTTCLTDYWIPALPLLKPQPFDQPFLLALTQAIGAGTNSLDPLKTPFPASTDIDYVRVWK